MRSGIVVALFLAACGSDPEGPDTISAPDAGNGPTIMVDARTEPPGVIPDAGPVMDKTRLTVYLRAYERGVEVDACDLRVFDRDSGEVTLNNCYVNGLELDGQRLATAVFVSQRVPVDPVQKPRVLTITNQAREKIGPEIVYAISQFVSVDKAGVLIFANVIKSM